MSLYESAKQESLYLEQKIAKLKKELAGLPEGELHIHKNGEKQKWFRSFAGANDKKRKGVFLKKQRNNLLRNLRRRDTFNCSSTKLFRKKVLLMRILRVIRDTRLKVKELSHHQPIISL